MTETLQIIINLIVVLAILAQVRWNILQQRINKHQTDWNMLQQQINGNSSNMIETTGGKKWKN